jgi:hypothetical protein
MKKTSQTKMKAKRSAKMLPEYRFDCRKAKPNRFAKLTRPDSIAVLLDPDVAEVFDNGKAVNAVLRALMNTMPARRGLPPQ